MTKMAKVLMATLFLFYCGLLLWAPVVDGVETLNGVCQSNEVNKSNQVCKPEDIGNSEDNTAVPLDNVPEKPKIKMCGECPTCPGKIPCDTEFSTWKSLVFFVGIIGSGYMIGRMLGFILLFLSVIFFWLVDSLFGF